NDRRRDRNFAEMIQEEAQLVDEIAVSAMQAEQRRDLADDRDADEPFDESAHHGRRDKGRDPACSKDAEQQEQEPDQDGEGARQRGEFGRSMRDKSTDR